MHKSLSEALDQEANTRTMLAAIKEEICNATRDSGSLEGVTPQQTSFPCAIVSFSAIQNNDFILSPNFYIQAAQADLVAHRLATASTVTDFISRTRDMVSNQYVRLSDGTTGRLNEKTVAVLESFL